MADPPQQNIRRFDVFAEWSRLVGREKKRLGEQEARRYGYAVAVVVAARKFSGHDPGLVREWKKRARVQEVEPGAEAWWDHLAKPTDFERHIVERMGADFYERVFRPTVTEAWEQGKDYTEIRDTLRKPWNDALRKTLGG